MSATALGLFSLSSSAHAWSTASSVTDGCHEEITLAALASAGWPDGATPPPLDEVTRRARDDMTFKTGVPADPWAVAMILGNEFVDLQANYTDDLTAIAREAARPQKQRDHCLRAPEDDGPEGNASALSACRSFILENVEAALGEGDELDVDERVEREVTLDFRGPTPIPVSRYAFFVGQALHALQDSYTHTFRNPSSGEVRHVLSYVDPLSGSYDEARDGHSHISALDQCRGDSVSIEPRVSAAIGASAELLAALADPEGGREGRLSRARTVLDERLALEEGCVYENDYCAAPELSIASSGCATLPSGKSLGVGFLAVAILSLFVLFRRARLPIALLVAGLAVPVPGYAQDGAETEGGARLESGIDDQAQADDVEQQIQDIEEEPGTRVVAVDPQAEEVEVIRRQREELDGGAPVDRGLGVQAFIFGGIDDAGLGFGGTLNYEPLPWLIVGVGGEYERWFSLSSGADADGVANIYGTATFVYGAIGPVEIRSTIYVGVSILLFDLVGADRGSVGPFLGISPVGIGLRATRSLRVFIDPGGFFVEIPQLAGIPLIRRTHRFVVGLHWTFL